MSELCRCADEVRCKMRVEIEQQKQALIEAETRILNLTEGMLKLVEESNQPETTKDSGRINRGDECPECGSDNTVRLMLSSGEQECQPCGHVFVTGKVTESHAWVNQGICCRLHATTEQRMTTMIVCPKCGDKRCARASMCDAECETGKDNGD